MSPACIICHMQISDSYEECPNGHAVHISCLREWLMHSFNCPLCNTKYDEKIIKRFQEYIREKDKEKEEELKNQLEKDNVNKIHQIGEKMVFLKGLDLVDEFVKQKEFKKALEVLDEFKDYKNKKYEIMFLRGKINYLRGRYDMAINHLFKLVKQNFEYPEAFLYLGRAYQALGLEDKAKWAFERAG
ncbi:MAG: hypothetical protein EU543_06320 [Promethearchaeota archaeon]|nr:MAG: hypothetical protein EU543_06320 [Candidatus Lokiarchaeota archaeon]